MEDLCWIQNCRTGWTGKVEFEQQSRFRWWQQNEYFPSQTKVNSATEFELGWSKLLETKLENKWAIEASLLDAIASMACNAR